VFRFLIVRLKWATPGRESDDTEVQPLAPATSDARARALVAALGGARNLTEVNACTTRLRLVLVDNKAVDEAALKRLGARGILRSSAQGLQVVLGPIADQVASEIRAVLRSAPQGVSTRPSVSPGPAVSVPTPAPAAAPDAPAVDARGLIAALGGRDNVVDFQTFAGRLLIRTARPEQVDESALGRLGIRGIAHSGADRVQVLVPSPVEAWGEPVRRLL
jgi:PTS system N-acetylglucosamine-specific IIC component